MGRTKTSGFQLAIFDKPPYYEHEVIANLEELSLTSSKSAGELNTNFQNIANTLNNASNNIVSSITNEADKTRIQSAIENEKIANGISETNYRLLDVTNGIEGLGEIVKYGNENVVEAIGQSSQQIINGLAYIDDSLSQINYRIEMVNSSLGIISNQLGELLKKISKPNETEALELADQARINLSLNKKEIALKVTRNALELSNGTSITVLAYHILTLSLFDDENSKKEINKIYEDYVNLVKFRLIDRQSDKEIIIQELDNTLYPVMSTMGYYASNSIMQLTQNMYTFLYNYIGYVMGLSSQSYNLEQNSMDEKRIENILKKPLFHDSTLDLITRPNQLREFHWSVLLNEHVIKKQSLDIYVAYVVALAKSEVLIKNELMILAVKNFNNEGFLYGALVDVLAGNSNEELNDALQVILSLLPQDIIDIDHKTYWAMKLYADSFKVKINTLLESKFVEAKEYVNTDIRENYIIFFDNMQQNLIDETNKTNVAIKEMKEKHLETSKNKMEKMEKNNKDIDDKGYENKIATIKKQISKMENKTLKNTGFNFPSPAVIFFNIILSVLTFSILGAAGLPTVESSGVGWIIVIINAIIVLPFVFHLIENIFINSNINKLNSLKDNLFDFEEKLLKKYNITYENEKLETSISQKIMNLTNSLETYKQMKRDNLSSKLNLLITKYIPSEIDQLSKTDKEIKDCIDKKIFGNIILSKRPNDLNYKRSNIPNSIKAHDKKKKYIEIDMETLATEYGEKWKSLHSSEEMTAVKVTNWIDKEAYRGDALAQYLLGKIHEEGDGIGIEEDMKTALFWFEKAANNDIAEAQCKVAQAHWTEHEKYGIPYDPSLALKWFKKARDIGHPSAKFNYGLLQYTGVGIEENAQKGIAWIKEARDDGLEHAREFLKKEGFE